MRIIWAYPQFNDYRIPVYQEVDRLVNHQFTLIYSLARTTARVQAKLEAAFGARAVGLPHERCLVFGKPEACWANKFLIIPYQPGLLRELLARKADIVIAEGFFQWTPAVLVKKVLHRIPLVMNYQKTMHTERNCPWWRRSYRRFILQFVDAMVCNGKLSAEYCTYLGMPKKAIFTGGNPAEHARLKDACKAVTSREKKRRQGASGLKAPVFLCAGRILPIKGIAELLAGWECFKSAESTRGSLLIVGDGCDRQALEAWARERKLSDVRFTGEIGYDEMGECYAVADVLIVPTLEDNWSLVVPEAMACGLPIACSKYNGCWPELVLNQINGIIFDPLIRQDIITTLSYFCDNENRLPEMGRASQEIVSQFTPERAAKAVIQACEYALKTQGAPA